MTLQRHPARQLSAFVRHDPPRVLEHALSIPACNWRSTISGSASPTYPFDFIDEPPEIPHRHGNLSEANRRRITTVPTMRAASNAAATIDRHPNQSTRSLGLHLRTMGYVLRDREPLEAATGTAPPNTIDAGGRFASPLRAKRMVVG
jgi:hypothetical protein